MSVPFGQWSFAAGELAPSLWGHVDLAKFHVGASTMRNCFASYRGGAYSRAGTLFVGYSKQTGRSFPPRLIDFQFSINQGLALEFGNEYMRVIQDGAFVTEAPVDVTGATQASPCVVSVSAFGIASATPVNTGVIASYAPGDTIVPAGGSFSRPGLLTVGKTLLLSTALNSPGNSSASVYAPGDSVTLTPSGGGTVTTSPILSVTHTQVLGATVANGGSGGSNGTQTVTGTTGTGTKFQASVTVAGGAITAVLGITIAGNYTVNPTLPSAEPVTGASLTGATLNLAIGILQFTIANAGVFTANGNGQFTQSATSGSGSGATFQQGLFAPEALTVTDPGIYASLPSNPVSQASSSGAGQEAQFNFTSTAASPFSNGDWVFLSGLGGMTPLNGNTYVVSGATPTSIQLNDVFGNPINSTSFPAYTSGGTAAKIFTLTTPWAEEDLPWLKWTESDDVTSICCWNQLSGTSYQPYELSRQANNEWTLTPFEVKPYTGQAASVTATIGAGSIFYQYAVTAVDQATGQEGPPVYCPQVEGVDIATTLGTVVLTWDAVPGAAFYNVYKAVPSYNNPIPAGAQFGFAAQVTGQQWNDDNTTPDFSQTPPLFADPFSPGQVEYFTFSNQGANITSCTVSINSATGSGFVGIAVIDPANNTVTGIIVEDPGSLYNDEADIVVFTCNAGATNPIATITTSPQSGTWPSLAHYFQERRGYAASPNQPDAYTFSTPGNFLNYNVHNPVIDSDAISGTPWAQQVNGIQFMLQTPGGDLTLTGNGAWQLGGPGGSIVSPQPITPSGQQAVPQEVYGCSATVPPLLIELDVLYVQAKGSIVRTINNINYWFVYTGPDITVNSSHLFTGFTVKEWAWAAEPYKLVWAVRNDGILLSLTWLKDQQVEAWARSDTLGLFQTVCSTTELPVDAVYLGVERFIGANGNSAYTIERMDNRIWSQAEDVWAVDCGLSLPQPEPAATLFPTAPIGEPTSATGLPAGNNFSSATTVTIADPTGSGCMVTPTIVNGVIAALGFSGGTGYTNPRLVFNDPSGQGRGISPGSVMVVLDNNATWTASANVFSSGNVGSVIRAGGGKATIVTYNSPTDVTVSVTEPIAQLVPGTAVPSPVAQGNWTMTAPVTLVSGLDHLAGQTVTGLADGNVIPPTVVSAQGTITLSEPASDVTVGLGFTAQLQSLYLPDASTQGQRKIVPQVTARIEASRGLEVGTNQPDGSAQSPILVAPLWSGLEPLTDLGVPAYGSNVVPLYTGDVKIQVPGAADKRAQVAIQQSNPLPMNILALIPEILPGDTPETEVRQRQRAA